MQGTCNTTWLQPKGVTISAITSTPVWVTVRDTVGRPKIADTIVCEVDNLTDALLDSGWWFPTARGDDLVIDRMHALERATRAGADTDGLCRFLGIAITSASEDNMTTTTPTIPLPDDATADNLDVSRRSWDEVRATCEAQGHDWRALISQLTAQQIAEIEVSERCGGGPENAPELCSSPLTCTPARTHGHATTASFRRQLMPPR